MMTALSISLPDGIANASKKAAQQLGISRTQFIRIAVSHELERLERQKELEGMVKAFKAMDKHSDYMDEIDDIEMGLSESLPEEEDEWWTKQKS